VAKELGADETVVADGSHVDKIMDMTDGHGAEVVLDFVGEMGAEKDGWNMTAAAGSHFIIGYGGTIEVPTIDIISTERNITGNLVGTYNDLAELMTLHAQGKVSLKTHTYSLDAVNDAVNDLNNGSLPGGRGILIPEGAAA
jgi:NAD+-dependent secondary alcohol dehydrogenase Adh1